MQLRFLTLAFPWVVLAGCPASSSGPSSDPPTVEPAPPDPWRLAASTTTIGDHVHEALGRAELHRYEPDDACVEATYLYIEAGPVLASVLMQGWSLDGADHPLPDEPSAVEITDPSTGELHTLHGGTFRILQGADLQQVLLEVHALEDCVGRTRITEGVCTVAATVTVNAEWHVVPPQTPLPGQACLSEGCPSVEPPLCVAAPNELPD